VATAQTGTGKTGAFMLPALQRMHLRITLERKQAANAVAQADQNQTAVSSQGTIVVTVHRRKIVQC
jgi:superfamily II DNA/RNA helicase